MTFSLLFLYVYFNPLLGASRRLRLAVDHVLSLLGRALENQQNQDLKLLLKRNEELSHELQEESQGRDAVHMELVTAESKMLEFNFKSFIYLF